ncbi:CDP-glycerol glycerophosphotransferase family protein [Sporosarcina sp. Marseille-Q4063]|uniref:CDP-glycerol glycerophosphotransferase family protein n=1 Tax=Sporosarcina sp. Marseille-Q4063 TaxID=2810514 RepID=UPI001BAEC168|nr:CDP-glycerol glycerophosphotransferase family protein [Sporosarcina sp. Marseille-Q4063]QUW21224.1 CDP-glycerol glycerophosphotransferase family protein [Sporosarcina sp. Marseille-Q4063]
MINKLKLYLVLILKTLSKIVYLDISFVIPIKKNRVVFVTPRHTELKDNLYYLYEEMKKSKPKLEYVIITRKINEEGTKWRRFLVKMFTDYYYLATARYFILDDYYLPLYFVRVRRGTEVIQLWHASGPLKRVGLSLRGYPDGPNDNYLKVVPIHSNYDKLIVNSDVEIDFYSEAFGMEKTKILPLGSPRTDILFMNVHDTTRKENFLMNHPQYENKELVLCAPTFRGRSTSSNPYVPHLDLEKLTPQLLEENKVLIFNLHPYMNENEEYMKNTDENAVFWNRNEYTIEELLMISDALISDYSSVIYDFAILEKPIALYCYDYEKYNKQRGFYVDIKQLLPATYFEEERNLVNWIVSDAKNITEVKQLKEKNFKYQNGQASKRIIESIFD